QIKRIANFRRSDNVHRLSAKAIESRAGVRAIEVASHGVECRQQRASILQLLQRLCRLQILDRFAERAKWTVIRAGIVWFLELELIGCRVAQADVWRQRRRIARQLADDRSESGSLAGAAWQAGVDLAQEVIVLDRTNATQECEPIHHLRLERH